jgi:putative endonuclease
VTRERVDLGRRGEAIAAAALERAGYRVAARNFRCPAGEIDLVVSRGPTLVFVEVRSRRGDRFGSGLESVDARKRRRLCRAAAAYLQRLPEAPRAVRFDVVAIDWSADPPRVEHVEAAFDC